MADPCFCHLNGYEVKDASARSDIETLQTEFASARSDIETLQTEFATARSDVKTLQTEFATARSDVDAILSNGIVNVKSFGAVGDGVTDDATAIQNAIYSGAETIIFPEGNYKISTRIKIPSNKKVVGYGANIILTSDRVCFINDADGITGGYDANENIIIEGISFNTDAMDYANCIALAHCKKIRIINCDFGYSHGYHLFELNSSFDVNIDGCRFHDYTGNSLTSLSEMLQIDYATVGGFSEFGPWDETPCKNIKINNCIFENPYTFLTETLNSVSRPAAIGNHDAKNKYHEDIFITNCEFINMHCCFMFINAKRLYISNCNAINVGSFYNNAHYNNTANFDVVGVQIMNCRASGYKWKTNITDFDSSPVSLWISARGIAGTARHAIIDGCTFENFNSMGLGLTSTNSQIVNCYICGNGMNGIEILNPSWLIISGNHVRGNDTLGANREDIHIYSNSNSSLSNIISNNFANSMKINLPNGDTIYRTFISNNNIRSTLNKLNSTYAIYSKNIVNGVLTD